MREQRGYFCNENSQIKSSVMNPEKLIIGLQISFDRPITGEDKRPGENKMLVRAALCRRMTTIFGNFSLFSFLLVRSALCKQLTTIFGNFSLFCFLLDRAALCRWLTTIFGIFALFSFLFSLTKTA